VNGACPICGTSASESARECPTCHLDVSLFVPVRDAAALGRDSDPVYYRTIAELFRTADLLGPAPELVVAEPPQAPVVATLPPGEVTRSTRPAVEAPAVPLVGMPAVPSLPEGDALRSRAHEYEVLASHLGSPLPELAARAKAADESGDERALADVVREMFVHVAGALVAGYDAEGARRNELAARGATPAADAELALFRSSFDGGDLTGASRHLARAREEIARLAEAWATERILLTECDLLAETIRELGGDPAPALGPLRDGEGHAPDVTELVLAQTTYALWVVLEPRFTEELKRIRDRLVELRHAGADVAPALVRLRTVAAEIRRRNFAGTIIAYRQLRELVRPGPTAPSADAPPMAPAERAA
jgi:hypothetical protein